MSTLHLFPSCHSQTTPMPKLNMANKRFPFEAKLLLLVCLSLLLFGCGSGETSEASFTGESGAGIDAEISEFPIVYMTRVVGEAIPDSGAANLVELDNFTPGAQLFVRARATSDAQEINITERIFGAGALCDVRGINISYDAQRMVFAARGPYDANVAEGEGQPSVWNLYEYDFATDRVYPIMNDSDAGLGHDITPHYLADGRIIFSSSRQKRTRQQLLDEGKPQYTYQVEVSDNDERFGPGFALHIAQFDGNRNLTAIEQVTFNRSHDFDPVLLPSGKVVFSRWDAAGDRDQVSLYRMNPDGAALEVLFGYRSQQALAAVLRDQFASVYGDASVFDALYSTDTEFQFSKPQVFSGQTELIAVLRPFAEVSLSATQTVGPTESLVAIDINNFVDVGTPLLSSSATGSGVRLLDAVAPESLDVIFSNGRVSAFARLSDGTNRAIVSLSLCRILNDDGTVRSCRGVDPIAEGLQEAPANYGLWLYDFDRGTQLPLILGDGDQQPYTEIHLVQRRDNPASIVDTTLDVAQEGDDSCDKGLFAIEDDFGIIHIRSVYDLDGSFNTAWAPEGVTSSAQLRDPVAVSADERAARFVRFEKPVYIPDPDFKDIPNSATARFGPFMREILGYAPVQPDGSVKVKVPADVPLMLTVVDQYGRRVEGSADHMNWMQVRPGEVRECNGCHSPSSAYPHGRMDAQAASLNAGASAGTLFANTNPQTYNVDISLNQDGSQFQPCLPDAGETMAEVYVRTNPARVALSPDLVFQDVWTDPDQRAPDDAFAYRYSAIQAVYNTGESLGDSETGTLPFNRGDCPNTWDAACRTVINYETHIQPLWEVTRNVTTDMGVMQYRCVDCHSNANPATGLPQIPAGQLSLTGEIVNNVAASFTDLVQNNFAFIDNGDGTSTEANNLSAQDSEGNVIPALEKQADGSYCYLWPDDRFPPGRLILPDITIQTQTVDIVVDGEVVGQREEPVLDDDGDPVPLTFSIRENNLGLTARLSRNGARASDQFRRLFEPGFTYSYFDCGTRQNVDIGSIDFDHSVEGMFSAAELKMIWEWLDIGSAYYNNPFDVPD